MNFDIKNVIDKYNYSNEKVVYLNDFKIVDVLLKKATGFTIIKAENSCFAIYNLSRLIILF